MILYQTGTTLGLLLTTLPVMISIWLYGHTPYKRQAIHWLLGGALLLRLLMILLDPYLQDWDERFHALVARNMMTLPFRPMLIATPVFPYAYDEWWNSHIWVHKQPLFLWQMALSMKILGVSTFALRLPSALLGVWMVKMIYDLGLHWSRKEDVAFLSALLAATSWYTLEMTAGWISLDHNDLSMTVYVTAGIWAWTRWLDSSRKIKWAVLTGFFVGCAILTKWLTAYLVFGGWGLYILISPELRSARNSWRDLAMAGLTSLIVFGPWQLYILNRFPREAAAAYAYNRLHIVKDLGHEGPWYFHLKFLTYSYHPVLVALLVMGIALVWIRYRPQRRMTIAMLAMVAVTYGFFAYVATKMPGLVHPVSGILLILMAMAVVALWDTWQQSRFRLGRFRPWGFSGLCLTLTFVSLMPGRIIHHRHEANGYRQKKIHNTTIYRNLPADISRNYVIMNCRNHEHLELMFYQGGTAHAYFPEESLLDSLQQAGYRFAAFDYDDKQELPEYILDDPSIIQLPQRPQ